MKKLVFLNICIFLFAFQNTTLAQDFSSLLLPEVNFSMTPESPEPNSGVYITLTSFETDLNSATIKWVVNGRTIKEGVAEKSVQFTVGNITSTTLVTVVVRTMAGDVVEKSISIKPSVVDLYWQSDSSVPPFYKGKALFAHQNLITVVALPQIANSGGVLLDPRVLTYTWKRNGSVQGDASGYGRNTYTFTSPLISRNLNISVEVTAPDVPVLGMGQIYLQPRDPEIILYEKKPLLGVQFQGALSTELEMRSPEITVVSYPFYFDTKFPFGQLVYKWSVNGAYLPESVPSQVFRIPAGVSGQSSISLVVEHTTKILQSTRTSLRLIFNQRDTATTASF